MVLNDVRPAGCLRISKVSVKTISVCNFTENRAKSSSPASIPVTKLMF